MLVPGCPDRDRKPVRSELRSGTAEALPVLSQPIRAGASVDALVPPAEREIAIQCQLMAPHGPLTLGCDHPHVIRERARRRGERMQSRRVDAVVVAYKNAHDYGSDQTSIWAPVAMSVRKAATCIAR